MMTQEREPVRPRYLLNVRGNLMELHRPWVMGILNLTPDSFYDGGRWKSDGAALQRVEQMLEEGADIIDIGGYSTRPGAADVSEDEELQRVLPVVEAIRQRFPQVLISVDTFRAKVAEETLAAGAHIINDVTGGREPEIWAVAGHNQAPYVLMHMQGTFATMQQNPQYEDVVQELLQYLAARVAAARQAGVKDVIVDPGFGFGKTVEHNYRLLKHLRLFHMLECPLLVGVSRKSMINKVLKTKPENALYGTLTVQTLALLHGAHILRVHDVKAAAHQVKIVEYYDAVV